uniref:Carboxypeptidase regulatory-like domain-containing protein n=1 Tax=Romanomermis culicivorax TaxID=13658 RepID=A0A915I3W2_ROMCU
MKTSIILCFSFLMVALALAEKYSIKGRIKCRGQAARGAKIILQKPWLLGWSDVQATTTDKDGKYVLNHDSGERISGISGFRLEFKRKGCGGEFKNVKNKLFQDVNADL